jgi:hypothetical protein
MSKNKLTLIKDKFSTSNPNPTSLVELKKLDIFDLGLLLTICATGGLEVLSEDLLSSLV